MYMRMYPAVITEPKSVTWNIMTPKNFDSDIMTAVYRVLVGFPTFTKSREL